MGTEIKAESKYWRLICCNFIPILVLQMLTLTPCMFVGVSESETRTGCWVWPAPDRPGSLGWPGLWLADLGQSSAELHHTLQILLTILWGLGGSVLECAAKTPRGAGSILAQGCPALAPNRQVSSQCVLVIWIILHSCNLWTIVQLILSGNPARCLISG